MLPREVAQALPPFWPNANDTLRQHADLHASVTQAIGAVKERRRMAAAKPSRLESVASLRTRVAEAKLVAEIAMRETKSALVRLDTALAELAAERAAKVALEREVKAALEVAQEQVTELRRSNAQLAAMLPGRERSKVQ